MIEGQTLPYSEEAEKAALGVMLFEPSTIATARHVVKLSPEQFYLPKHQMVCTAIFELTEAHKAVDETMLVQKLRDKDELDRAGGVVEINKLVDAGIAAHARDYFETVRQKAILRRAIYVARDVENEAFKRETGEDFIATVPQRFMEVVRDTTRQISNEEIMQSRMKRWRDANQILAKQENRAPISAMGLTTPWDRMTMTLCGFDVGLNIICGRPSQGKTTLAGELAMHWLEAGVPGAIVEMDITTDRFLQRCACRKAGVSLAKIKQGFATPKQLEDVEEAQKQIAKWPLWIEQDVRDIRAVTSWLVTQKMEHKIRWAVIDHMTCMTDERMGTNWNMHMLYGQMCHMLKATALKLELPTILLWQLSKETDKKGRPPILSDLRETGSGEEDATTVTAVYQDKKIHDEMEEEQPGATQNKRPTWVEILKNQDGETGKLPFWFLGSYFQFQECDGFGNFKREEKPANSAKGREKGTDEVERQKDWADDMDNLGVSGAE